MTVANSNPVIKFEIVRNATGVHVVATYQNGFSTYWGDVKTEVGARACLKKFAKWHKFTVTGETAQIA